MLSKIFPCSVLPCIFTHSGVAGCWAAGWRLWDWEMKSVPWKTTAGKWGWFAAQHVYFSSNPLCFFTVCPRWKRDSQGEKPCILWYLHLALHVVSLICLLPFFLHVCCQWIRKDYLGDLCLPEEWHGREKIGEMWDGGHDHRRTAPSGNAAEEEDLEAAFEGSSWLGRCNWTHECCSHSPQPCLPGASLTSWA